MLMLAGCAEQPSITLPNSPEGTSQQNIAKAFREYKGHTLLTDQFGVVEQTDPPAKKPLGNGFYESEFFVFYWPTTECVEGYTVFERCNIESCDYRFEWVEGVCD
jgi:hypothetical protein